jgi:CRISPR-associated exonuclease Cas4
VNEVYSEDQFLPLSGLQHMVFCDRQAGLIHVDRLWSDNALTVEGTHLHRVVDEGGGTLRDGIRTVRGMGLRSVRLGLVGKADVVELHPLGSTATGGAAATAHGGRWRILPVEYKRGRPKTHRADEVQLCAQAICLEEAFQAEVSVGHLYYGRDRRRTDVRFDTDLRRLTEETARAFHDLVDSRSIPIRGRERKCDRCSLIELCMPPRRNAPSSARRFTENWVRVHLSEASDS